MIVLPVDILSAINYECLKKCVEKYADFNVDSGARINNSDFLKGAPSSRSKEYN